MSKGGSVDARGTQVMTHAASVWIEPSIQLSSPAGTKLLALIAPAAWQTAPALFAVRGSPTCFKRFWPVRLALAVKFDLHENATRDGSSGNGIPRLKHLYPLFCHPPDAPMSK